MFYPRTFWRILWHPGAIARYTRMELQQEPDRQFQETISPVLMLILSVALAHAMELAFKLKMPPIASPVGQLLFGSEQGLLLTRSAVFCVYALGAALGTLRQERRSVTRDSLREPFSIHAFLVCPFLVLFSVGMLLVRTQTHWSGIAGHGIVAFSIVWYLLARTIAYRTLYRSGWIKALALVCASFFLTTIVILGVVALLVL